MLILQLLELVVHNVTIATEQFSGVFTTIDIFGLQLLIFETSDDITISVVVLVSVVSDVVDFGVVSVVLIVPVFSFVPVVSVVPVVPVIKVEGISVGNF